MYKIISNKDEVIDSRDIIARIEALRDLEEFGEPEMGDRKELADLLALESEASGSPDWSWGEALIRDSYFEDYAHELARDVAGISEDLLDSWPFIHIDWEQASRDLQVDYFSVDFDGVEYWIRS